jgi:hypothetical protein
MAAQQELMKTLGVAAGQVNVIHTPNARTVDGVSFDAIRTDFKMDPDDPSAAQAEQVMSMMYGPDGATVLLGAVDGKLVSAIGLREETLTSSVKAIRAGDSAVSELAGVKMVAGNLPRNNIGVVYVPVDQIVTTGLSYARQFGMPMQIQLPPDLPPIGSSVATEGPALRVDVFIPSQLVQSLVAAGMQAAMQMQGGPGGGGGGL